MGRGKDSCIALYEIQRTQGYRVAALLTTLTRDYDRISMHGVRRGSLEKQATSLKLRYKNERGPAKFANSKVC